MKFEPMMSGSKLVSTAVPLHSFALTLYTIEYFTIAHYPKYGLLTPRPLLWCPVGVFNNLSVFIDVTHTLFM